MKEHLTRAEDLVRGAVDRLRTWFDPPLEADARPLEIREGIIEDIEQRAEPAGGGRRVLPYNHVTVTVLTPSRHDRIRLQATLIDLEDAVRTRLRELRCSTPTGFAVLVRYVRRPPPDWGSHQRLALDYDSRDGIVAAAGTPEELPRLRVTVTRGETPRSSYKFAESHVLIGRGEKPIDGRGRPRLNHIAFAEEGDEHTQTVGRAHASIHYDPARREYRLFDDGSQNGTRILRQGTLLDVVRRDPVGVTLKSGDEIQVGTAAMRVEIDGGG
jgi:hypothetical protein